MRLHHQIQAWVICLLSQLAGSSALAADAGFVGSASCAGCHASEHQAWLGSHHDLAMQHAGPETVLGDFSDVRFTYAGVTSTFFRRGDGFFVRTDGADGRVAEFQIRYTFGFSPLQQYLVEFADGRLQALGIAWDSRPRDEGGQRWFHLYPEQAVDNHHELHWTGPQQNWNYMCADCHSTEVQKGYDPETDRFSTTWSEIDVGCEACHGPGGAHVDWAAAEPALRDADARKGWSFTLARTADLAWPLDPDTGSAKPQAKSRLEPEAEPYRRREIEICADCHARRGVIQDAPERDPRFLSHYMPALLTRGLYHVDGQIQDEVFVWGSFSQSRMHQAGVSCSNCHDPHSQRLLAPGDEVCAGCHAPATFASEKHHRHRVGSPGASCVDCHMPETTYMVVDPRRDHSIRIPRPDLSVTLGVPNACNRCHQDRSADWAAAHFARWYPEARGGQQTWARAFAAARRGNPAAEMQLVALLQDPGVPDIARATALLELQAFLSPASGDALQQAISDASPLVRIAALRALEVLPPEQRYRFAAPLLEDDLLAVRIEAGRVLAALSEQGLSEGERTALRRAVADYVRSQELNADRADARTNLGNLFQQRGNQTRAESEFRRAIGLDPRFEPAYVNLSDLYRLRGMDEAAAEVLQQGLQQVPDSAALHHAMGLLLVRGGQTETALRHLEAAAQLGPEDARYAYVFGVALNSAGRSSSSVAELERGLAYRPFDRNLLFALVTINRDRGDLEAARHYARKMLEMRPRDEQAAQLLRSLREPD